LLLDNYTERDVRLHITRLRDLLGGPYKQITSSIGIDSSVSFLTAVTGEIGKEGQSTRISDYDTDTHSYTYTDEEFATDGDKKMEDMFSTEPIPEHAFTGVDVNAPSKLSDFVPSSFERTSPQCLKSLSLSGWNPVSHPRRLAGDLMYLNVVTLENESLCITASTTGFFVNNSTPTEFNPNSRGANKRAHSLIRLLQSLSPQFAANFIKVQDFITKHHMLEVLPVNTYLPSYPWAAQPTEPTYDLARPTEPYLNYGVDAVDSLRDWNDELQTHRELPKSNLQERVLRERLITKVQSEFTDAAVRGAIAVVNGSVVPLNPMEPEESYMYVYNNIFFSKGNDGRGTFETLGADEAAHVATGKDLEGVKILNSIDTDGLYTLGSVIVDYKGIRVVAQSIVPGIFRRQDENSIVYGSVDNGVTITANEAFHESIEQNVAKPLHLAEHALVDAEGKSTKLYTSLETKGLLGADGRRYLLDLYRLNPVDIEFQDAECAANAESGAPAYPHKMTLLRPELMSMYWEHMFRQWYKAKVDVIRKERAVEAAPEKESSKDGGDDTKAADAQEEKEQQQAEEEDFNIDASEFQLSFNPDVFTDVKQGEGEHIKEQEQVIREASKFLNNEIIPTLVLDFASYAISPLDGDALTKAMHRRGINMRYLGKLAKLVSLNEDKRIRHIQALAVQEMVVRASKRLLRKYTATLDLETSRLCLSHYLNCLLGGAINAKPTPVLPAGKNKNDYSWAHLTPQSLKKIVQVQVLLWFRYSLTDDDWSQLKPIPTLRETCIRTGIQLEARDYRFAAYTPEEVAANTAADAQLESLLSRQKQQQQQQQKTTRKVKKQQRTVDTLVAAPRRKTTFVPEDILNILPTVKQASTRVSLYILYVV
jgi:protein TIF31